MNHAVFRTDASDAIGGGHVMRCLTLADELQARGWSCVFSCTSETVKTVRALATSGYKIISADEKIDCADILIVDHYGLDRRYEEQCRTWAKRIVVIDDLADRPHDCNLLMDQTFGRDPNDYKALVPAHCHILTGPEHALLRPQFAAARPASLTRRQKQSGKVDRILIMMGTSDKDNTTGLALSALALLEKHLNIDVILGGNAPHLQAVKQQAQESRHSVTIHTDINDVAALMSAADLCIGAGGTASWERCCMGLPTLVIEIADNQKKIIRELGKAKAISNAGQYRNLTPEILATMTQDLIDNANHIAKTSAMAAEICDGKGTIKLAYEIENLEREVNNESSTTITLP